MYIHSVYKESPRHYLSIEIKDHKILKFKTHVCNHHSLNPGHITGNSTECIAMMSRYFHKRAKVKSMYATSKAR